jgi:pimeloyl-ACP methyl ester carboxylesterase
MRRIALIALVFTVLTARAQDRADAVLKLWQADSIVVGKDTIRYVTYRRAKASGEPADLFVFCQGSQPIPLLPRFDGATYPPVPFDPELVPDNYLVVVVGKPGIPVTAAVNEEMLYKPGGRAPATYLYNDNLHWYAKATKAVIAHLKKAGNRKRGKVVLFGHSQGYRVAARVAATCKYISRLVVASANPFSRYHGGLTVLRNNPIYNAAHLAEKNEELMALYTDYRDFVRHRSNRRLLKVDRQFANWVSFNYPSAWRDLVKVKVPVLVLYGDRDDASLDNDLLPFLFAEVRQQNVKVQVYPGREHNFFETLEDGTPDYSLPGWDLVMTDVCRWLQTAP